MKKTLIAVIIPLVFVLLFMISCSKKDEEVIVHDDVDTEEENTEKQMSVEALKEVTQTFTHDGTQFVDVYEIPCLTAGTDAANAINEKILSHYPESVLSLSTDKEEDEEHDGCFVFSYKYDVYEKDGKNIAAILLEQNNSYFNGEFYDEHFAFYYDVENDAELTFDEYLKLIGSDRETVAKNSIPYSLLAIADGAEGILSEKMLGGIYGGEDDIILFFENTDSKGSTYLTVPLSPMTANKMTVTTEGSSLNLRKTPSSSDNSEILARIPSGTVLDVYSYYDEWSLVEYDGQYGYVSAEYLK